jgi:hypothetical protein
MHFLRPKKLIVLALAVLAAVVLSATAISAVWAQVVHIDTYGGIHLRVVSTSADGFDSGWHTHPGLTIVQVREGSLQITQGGCTAKTVGPGETFMEVPFQPVRAVAAGRVVWTTTFLLRTEDPTMTSIPSPCP